MKRPFVKLLTLLLALALIVSIVPATLADGTPVTLDPKNKFKDGSSTLSNAQFINGREALEAKIIIQDPGNLNVGDTISLSKIISTTDMTEDEIEAGIVPYVWDGEKGKGQKFEISDVSLVFSKDSLGRPDDVTVDIDPWSQAETVLRTPFPRDRDYKKGSNGLSITWTLDPGTKVTFDTVTYDFNLPSKDGTTANPYYVENLNDLGIANAYFNEAYISGDDLYSLKTTGESVIVGSSIPYWPNKVASHADFIGIVGGIPTEPNGSNIQTFYRFLGWKIQGSDTLYSKTNMPEMTEGGISLVAQWEEVDLDTISLTPAQEALKIPFSDAVTVTYEDQTSEVVDAVISQHNSSEEASWSQNNANDPLSLQSDRIVYYKAELTMNDFIAGTGDSSLGYGIDILANRPIDDPTFASFQIDVDLDDHLQVVANNDGYVSFTFTCSFLQPVTNDEGYAKITTADSIIWTRYTSNTVNVNVSENSNIRLPGIGPIAGLPTTSTAYTYTVSAEALTSNAFTLHMEWKPVGKDGYSYQELLSPITLEVAAAKISADFNGVVQTTGKITGSIDLRKAETGKSESEVATYLQNDPEWFNAFKAEEGQTPDVEDIFRKTKIVRDSLANVYLTANTVYAEVPTYDVTIRYLEKGSKDVLADSVTISDVYSDTTLDLSEYLDKDIRGYRQVEVEVVPDNATIDDGEITMPSDDVVINVYYERNPIIPILPGLEFPDGDIPGLLNLEDHYAYIIGYDDGKVKPQNNITRAEVATIFFRLLTDDARAYYWSTDSGFSDVHEGDWYNNAVSTMVNAGILNGYSDGTFKPNANITRAEFATIAARFLSNSYSLNDRFYDTEGHWAEPYINRAAEVGWINGYNDGSFKPDQAITRAEAVTLVNAVLGREPHEDHLLSRMVTWPDNPKSAWYYEDIQEATNSHDYVWASGNAYEIWTELLENRDWAKLEKEWSNAYSAPGGNVMG